MAGQHTSAAEGPEIAQIQGLTGREPALRGFDLLSYSAATITANARPDTARELGNNRGTVEAAQRWWREGGLVTVCWHWFAPTGGSDKTFYTKNTSCDVRRVVMPGTPEHAAALHDIDRIADALGVLDAAGVPVLWRPLHEADGGWFWWGAYGPEPYLELYRLLWNRLTTRGLHNLIWVWNAPHPDWYPGDAVVDIAGDDIYADAGNYGSLALSYQYAARLAGGRKMVALTENGAIPDPDRLIADDARWLWFMPWWGGGATFGRSNSPDHVAHVYHHPYVLTREDLPRWT